MVHAARTARPGSARTRPVRASDTARGEPACRVPHGLSSLQPAWWLALALGIVAPAVTGGCTPAPALDATKVVPQPSPDSATTEIRDEPYRSVIGDYHRRIPVEPQPWRAQNEKMAPRGEGKE
jgi:hypothetical protein